MLTRRGELLAFALLIALGVGAVELTGLRVRSGYEHAIETFRHEIALCEPKG